VLRTVRPDFAVSTQRLLVSELANNLMARGWLVPTKSLGFQSDGSLELEHDRVFFPSYPWEWSAEQWVDAAVLTLDLCDELIGHGLILKDATPLNILFDGPRPMLVDLLSIEAREAANPMWNAYGQFVRTFVLPLMAHKYLGWPLAASQTRRDGYEPGDLYPYLPIFRRWFGPGRGFVTLPILFDRMGRNGSRLQSIRFSEEASTSILHSRLRQLRKTVLRLGATDTHSNWSGYVEQRNHYADGDRLQKQAFVKRALEVARPESVLDIGANTGEFSHMAVESGARVVAVDTDSASTAIHYMKARDKGLSILPLHADIARPTPPAGWKNQESLSLIDRCQDRFDCLLMLGLLHHLLVTDQIPLGEIATLAFELAPRCVIVEWIPPTDPKFVEVCRGRDALYEDLTEEKFIGTFGLYFRTVEREALSNGRVLFLLESR
jgi:SAM-dependent methyltransferase